MHCAAVMAEKFCRLAKEATEKEGKVNDLTAMKLMQLIYLAHGLKLAITDTPLVADEIRAWNHGPVIENLYNIVRKKFKVADIVTSINGVEEIDVVRITPVDQRIVSRIYATYGKYSAGQLATYTQGEGTPWHKIDNSFFARDNLIKDEDTKAYYKKPIAKELLKAAKEEWKLLTEEALHAVNISL